MTINEKPRANIVEGQVADIEHLESTGTVIIVLHYYSSGESDIISCIHLKDQTKTSPPIL